LAIDDRKAWSILTKTRKGVVSVLRDLTLVEAKNIYQRLNPEFGSSNVFYQTGEGCGYSGAMRSVSDNEIDLREVFGPEDWDRSEIREWDKGPDKILVDYSDPTNPYNPANYGKQKAPASE
jgi:hypothetical protein